MFRPNRIGTPIQYQTINSPTSSDFTLSVSLNTANTYPANVINAAPHLDFGTDNVHFSGTEALAAASKCALVQQFTITPPVNGDTVGVEVSGSLLIATSVPVIIRPIFAKMVTALSGLLTGTAGTNSPVSFGSMDGISDAGDSVLQNIEYRQNIIVRDTTLAFGTYCHGFQILNNGVLGNITYFYVNGGIRQLNDQQNIGYRDTRR